MEVYIFLPFKCPFTTFKNLNDLLGHLNGSPLKCQLKTPNPSTQKCRISRKTEPQMLNTPVPFYGPH